MRNYTLGPPIETYGPNIRIAAILAAAGGFICLLAFSVAHEIKDTTAWAIFLGLSILLSGGLLWQLSYRAAVHETGVSCQNFFFSKEMRWYEVERFYFGCHEVHAHFIPLGSFYSLKLRNVHGQSLSLSNRIRHAEDFAHLVARFTLKPLLEKALQSFQSGNVISFGAITVAPSVGVTLKKLFFDKTLKWQDIEAYEVNSSCFKFQSRQKLFSSWTILSEKIANPHVLKALLDSVMQNVWARS
jgi:hypothetical protein